MGQGVEGMAQSESKESPIKWTTVPKEEHGNRVVVDPNGDILLVVDNGEMRIQVSSAPLVAFSHVFRAMLTGRFKEALEFKNASVVPNPVKEEC